MRRALALALLLAAGADANALADAIWTQKQHAANFPLDQLPAPSAAASPSTAPVRPIDLNPAGAPCILQAPGANGLPVCATPLSSLSVTDPISSTGGASPTLGLKFDNATITLNGGGAIQTGAETGAITKAAGATTTIFGNAGPFTVLANLTSGSATPTFVGPGSSGQFLGQTGWATVPGASVYADGIATGTTQLASIAAASLAAGTVAYVASVGDFFSLKLSALTTTATTVVTASGKSGYQWIRMNIQNAANQLVTAWFVDPQAMVHACSDEATGLASSAPLCTMAELARRMHGANYPVGTTGVAVFLESSMGSTDGARFDYRITGIFATSTTNPSGFDSPFNIIGVPTDLGFSGVVSSPQNGTPGTNNDIHFTDSGIPASFTASGFLATNVIFKRTNGTVAWFWPAKDLGSKTIRVSQPNTALSTYANLAASDTYGVLQLPAFHGVAFPHPWNGFSVAQVFGVDVDSATATLDGNESVYWFASSIENLQYLGGVFEDCQLVGQQNLNQNDVDGQGGTVNSGLARKPAAGGNLNHWVVGTGAEWVLSDEAAGFITFEGIPLIVDVDGRGARLQGQFFDITGSMLLLEQGGFLNLIRVGGAGNTGKLFNSPFTAGRITYATAPPSGVTSDSAPIEMGGTSFALAALPVVDAPSNNYFVPEIAAPAFTAAAMVKSNASGYYGPAADGTDYLSPTTGVLVTRRINTTAPMTGGGSLSSDLTIATPVFAGGAAGLVPSSAGGTANFLRADGSFAVPPGTAGSAVTSLTGPVTGTGPGATATSINFGGGGISGTLALANEGAPSGSGFPHVTSGAWDPAARAVDLSGSDVANKLPLVALAQGGASTTNLLAWSGTAWAPTAAPTSLPPSGAAGHDLGGTYPNPNVVGLTDSGATDHPIDVLTAGQCMFIDATTGHVTTSACGGSSGLGDPGANGIVVRTALNTTTARTLTSSSATITVTNGSGVSGNPNVDLPGVGPGAGLIGGAGISSVTLDAQGRVTAAGTATYLTGNQTITLTGPVTGSGTTSIATTISGLPLSDLATQAANTLVANTGSTTAVPTTLALGSTSGVMEYVNGTPDTLSVYAAGSARVPFGSGTGGELTDDANLTYVSATPELLVPAGGLTTPGVGFTGFPTDGFSTILSGARISTIIGGSRVLDVANGTMILIPVGGIAQFDLTNGSGGGIFTTSTAINFKSANNSVNFATAALATNFTTGYMTLPSTAGVPSGTPANIETGQIPLVVDSTDDRLYFRNSSWKPYGQFTGGLASGPLCNTTTTGIDTACTSASLTTLIGALSGDLGGTLPSPTVTAIHSGSAQHPISASLVNGNTLALDGSGNVVTVSSAPSYALNWAMNASGLSMAYDSSTLYFPGMASAQLATETASAGTPVTTTMASNWSSGASSPTFPLRAQYNQAQLTVDVPLVAASGTGSATIRFALYQVVTSPGTGANYTEICHTDLGGITAGPTSSFQTLGCTGNVSSTLASVFLVVYRGDVNNLMTITNLVFEAAGQFWSPS